VKVARVQPGRREPAWLAGAVLTRDLRFGDTRWSKGRRLSLDDLDALYAAVPSVDGETTVLIIEPGELHEDEAALRLAAAVAGPGLVQRGPNESRVDLVAAHAGVVHVRAHELELLNRVDPLEVFTVLDGQVVSAGDLVGSVKVAPHVVPAAAVEAGARQARGGARPLVWVAPFIRLRVAAIVKESVRGIARERFESSLRAKVETLGSEVIGIDYVTDQDEPVLAALEARTGRGRDGRRRRPAAAEGTAAAGPADVLLTAGAASTDPLDPVFTAIAALGGRIVRHGVPAHPGSMLWLARVGRTAILGLPTCGAYSKATAADLLLPRLLTGEPPTVRTVSRLGHGGILTRSMRFRFPPYARQLDAPDG
jgi:hypothetical protein